MPEGTVDQSVDQNKPVADTKPADSKLASDSGTPDPAKNTGAEDARVKGLTADLQKERKARQEAQKRYEETQRQHEEARRQIAALTGAKTPTAQEAEIAEAKKVLEQMYPQLGTLTAEKVEKLLALPDVVEQLRASSDNAWRKEGNRVLDSLHEAVEDELGTTLSDRQKRTLETEFVHACAQDPDMEARLNAGDPKLLAEFAKAYVEDWLKVAERRNAGEIARRNRVVPRGGDRTINHDQPPPKINYNDPKAVEDALVAGFKERGGTFGRKGI